MKSILNDETLLYLSFSLIRTNQCSVVKKNVLLLKTWRDEICISVRNWICNQMKNRKKWQRIEFFTYRVIAILLLIATEKAIHNEILTVLHQSATPCVQVLIFRRILAYAVDFANASKKLGCVPTWLILQHASVVAIQVLLATKLSQSYYKTVLHKVALKVTHSTWLKKIAAWCSVITSLVYTTLNIIDSCST